MMINIPQEMIDAFVEASGYPHIGGEQGIKRGIEAALELVSNCQACPDDCGECSKDGSDCECYMHQSDHPVARGNDALTAIAEQAERGTVTRARVKRIAEHFGFEVQG